MATGTIKKLVSERGFGFIQAEDGKEYFFHRSMHVYRGFSEAPGYRSLRSVEAGLRTAIGSTSLTTSLSGAERGWKDYISDGTIIAGSPESVTEQLHDLSEQLHIGHLLLLLQFGNMGRQLTLHNTELFAKRVMPQLADLFEDEWEDRWWPRGMPAEARARPREVSR